MLNCFFLLSAINYRFWQCFLKFCLLAVHVLHNCYVHVIHVLVHVRHVRDYNMWLHTGPGRHGREFLFREKMKLLRTSSELAKSRGQLETIPEEGDPSEDVKTQASTRHSDHQATNIPGKKCNMKTQYASKAGVLNMGSVNPLGVHECVLGGPYTKI